MRRLGETELAIAVLTYLLGSGSCITGCSAGHWLGEAAGQLPGLHVKGGSAFARPSLDLTGDTQASLEALKYTGSTESQPSSIEIKGLTYNQQPSADLPLLPPIIEATAQGQRTQTEYMDKLLSHVDTWVDTAGTVINFLSALKVRSTTQGLQLGLPGGLTIGGQKVSTPVDVSNYLNQLKAGVESAKAALHEARAAATQPTP